MEDESASVTVRCMERKTHVVTFKNYSRMPKFGMHEEIESAQFGTGPYQWTILFYPNGYDEDVDSERYVSLFLSLKSKSDLPVRCLYELVVVDQYGRGNDSGFSYFKTGEAQSIRSGGISGSFYFMKQKTLKSFVKDDCLKFRCVMEVFYGFNRDRGLLKVPESNIGAEFGRLLESKRGVDVFFRVENESFSAHKLILTARSPVFRSLLSDCHQGQEIVIPDMESRIFKAVLWFIYTGTLPEELQEVMCDSGEFILKSYTGKMLAAADRYQLKGLKLICESTILRRVSKESVAYVLHLAELCHATELKAACLRFAVENREAVMESDGCYYLQQTCPSLFEELLHYEENPSTGGGEELDLWSRLIFAAKKSFVGMFWSQDARDMKPKIKEY